MNYQQLAESRFAGETRPQLRTHCKTLGVSIGPNESEESMVRKLCAHLGFANDEPETAAQSEQKVKGIPNLSTEGNWEGKWYELIIRCNDDKIIGCPLATNGRYTNYALNEVVRMPAPHYNNLKDRIGGKVTQTAKVLNGQVVGYDKEVKRQQLYTYEDVRVVPGTEHLPESYYEYFQRLARAKKNFAGFSRQKLLFIHSILKEHVNADTLREMKDEEILASILRALGPEFDNSNDVDFELDAA